MRQLQVLTVNYLDFHGDKSLKVWSKTIHYSTIWKKKITIHQFSIQKFKILFFLCLFVSSPCELGKSYRIVWMRNTLYDYHGLHAKRWYGYTFPLNSFKGVSESKQMASAFASFFSDEWWFTSVASVVAFTYFWDCFLWKEDWDQLCTVVVVELEASRHTGIQNDTFFNFTTILQFIRGIRIGKFWNNVHSFSQWACLKGLWNNKFKEYYFV